MPEKIKGSYRALIGYLGFSLMCVGCIMIIPLVVILAYPEERSESTYFIIPGGMALLAGYLLFLVGRGKKAILERQQDAVLVVLFWVSAIVLSSLPFRLTGKYTFAQAVFEATSGWSTTGLSVVDVESASKMLLMYRSVLLFFGGLGIVLIMSTLLAGSGGMQLFNAEGHTDRLVPNLLESARIIFLIYSGFILAGTILYGTFGMGWFDAINHSIAAVSTGGFSTRAASIGYYDSPAIELTTIVLMILGNIGFAAHILLFRGKIRAYFSHDEFRFFAFTLSTTVPIVAILLLRETGIAVPTAVRVAAFQTISALTTTGFQTVESFNGWSPALTLIVVLLMLVGGGIGSTAGGIKQYRVYTLARTIVWSLRDSLSFPGTVNHDRMRRPSGDETMDYRAKTSILSFIALYLSLYFLGALSLCMLGVSIPDALFEFASAMGTVGLSRGIMCHDARPAVLWIGSVGMFVGRLEMLVLFIAAHKVWTDARGFISANGDKVRRHAKKLSA